MRSARAPAAKAAAVRRERWPEGPVNFVMPAMAAKPSGGSGATF